MELSEKEQKILEELLKEYKGMPSEQELIKFEVEQGILPSTLKDIMDMF